MTATVTEFADGEEFARLTDGFRRELLAHCYRMLGSVHDAEDLLQETFLRAWRAHEGVDARRASLRTRRSGRPLPGGLASPTDVPEAALDLRREIPWLQPIPGALPGFKPGDPAAVV